jgi:hypothetical protein
MPNVSSIWAALRKRNTGLCCRTAMVAREIGTIRSWLKGTPKLGCPVTCSVKRPLRRSYRSCPGGSRRTGRPQSTKGLEAKQMLCDRLSRFSRMSVMRSACRSFCSEIIKSGWVRRTIVRALSSEPKARDVSPATHFFSNRRNYVRSYSSYFKNGISVTC